MIRSALLGGLAADGIGLAAQAQMIGPSPAGGHRATMAFITQAAQSDEFERREGRLAEQRARDPGVRAFARQMVHDHTLTTQHLKAAMIKAGITPPPPPQLSADQANLIHQLMTLNGPAFDKTYIDQQVTAHQDALQLMNGFAQGGEPQPLRRAAMMTAPMVQQHLDKAERLQAHLGG